MSRFVTSDVKVLKISQGDTLTVKSKLNWGEVRSSFSRVYVVGADGERRVDSLLIGYHTVLAYLVDWTFTDDAGKLVVIRDQPVDVVAAALDALDPDSFKEVRQAIEAHDVEVKASREQLKKDPDGETASSAISPSPEPVTGDSSGSENLTLLTTT